MKLLYVPSGHPLQEADDILMWEKLGIQWVSTGYYRRSSKPGDLPEIQHAAGTEDLYEELEKQELSTFGCDEVDTLCGQKNSIWTGQVIKNKVKFTAGFMRKFDAIVFSHFAQNASTNITSVPTYLKTYGMHSEQDENIMHRIRRRNRIKVIRNSPVEHLKYKKYAGHDFIIRGSVVRDEHELSGWVGDIDKICTFTSFFHVGDHYCIKRRNLYMTIAKILNNRYKFDLWGAASGGFLSHNDKLNVLKRYKVNLVTGTPGSNNTYSFVEALVMGQPTVVFGPEMWQSTNCEIPNLITHGEHAFIGNTAVECADYIEKLINEKEIAEQMSKKARLRGIELFGRENLSKQWEQVFKS